ncbi:MAG: hypothetical protein A3H29_12515 [Acidobacteria bacterium RIFCSPLOWO2_02_FULL_67_21]|nr:MAG: hypothetical protein A3H29_12515 [Acidobacteria bacterium RIFCSPLOWO2_02_FULL_67_21]
MRIGIDLGGTKIEAVALDGSAELSRVRIETPHGDYGATLDAVVEMVRQLEAWCGGRGTVGVGIPGTVSSDSGLVKNANSVWLIGRPLKADLEQRLDREIRLANDANCFAISEATDGAGAGADVVFGAIVGTGTGAGIVVRGRLLTGPNGIAGEWGHNSMPWPEDEEHPGPPCYCGRQGCIETFLSGPGLQADYHRRAGRSLSPPAILEAAEAGERDASEALDRYEDRMARSLASIINVLDPDVIVLGGGLSNIARLYTNVPVRWGRHVFAAAEGREPVRTTLVPARHGDASGVRGAAGLWPD